MAAYLSISSEVIILKKLLANTNQFPRYLASSLLPILLISNYHKRVQLVKGKINALRNTSLRGAEFLVTALNLSGRVYSEITLSIYMVPCFCSLSPPCEQQFCITINYNAFTEFRNFQLVQYAFNSENIMQLMIKVCGYWLAVFLIDKRKHSYVHLAEKAFSFWGSLKSIEFLVIWLCRLINSIFL